MHVDESPIGSLGHVFRAVVITVVPPAADLDEAAWSELEDLVATALGKRPPALLRKLRTFLRIIQWMPAARYGRPFSSLSHEQRQRVLFGLERHRIESIRLGFWGLRTLALMGYYGRPSAAALIGYRPRPSGWEAHRG